MAEYRLAPKARDDMEIVWLFSSQVILAQAGIHITISNRK